MSKGEIRALLIICLLLMWGLAFFAATIILPVGIILFLNAAVMTYAVIRDLLDTRKRMR